MGAALERVAKRTGYPQMITVDNGSEFTSKALDAWAHAHGVKLDFIRPEKPVENAVIESFNGRFRDEGHQSRLLWLRTVSKRGQRHNESTQAGTEVKTLIIGPSIQPEPPEEWCQKEEGLPNTLHV